MKRWWTILPLAAFIGLVAVGYMQLTGGHPAPASFTSPARPAPDFAVAGLDGGEVKLADFKGRPVLVNFWGSYCAPCKLEHPLLMEMAAQGVEIVGMLYKDGEPDKARDILAKDGNPFRLIGVDRSGDLGIDIGISGVPESFLIDANGQIVKTKRNYFTEQDVPEFVAAYKAEQAKAGQPAS
jgi:cytochrome c biogenesis protein CcmG/thiol:disulfide interchange protein DsbE